MILEIITNRRVGGYKVAKVKINEILDDLRKEIPGFIAADVVSRADGISIGGKSIDPKLNTSIASAYYANVVNAYIKALNAMDPNVVAEDLLITTDKFYILFRLLGGSGYYLSLFASLESNLGIIRLVMKKYEEQILKSM